MIEKTNKSIHQTKIYILFQTFCMMSIESTVSTAQGCIDVADASQVCHTINSQDENGGSSRSEISELICYPRNFFHRTTSGLPKDEEAACCLWPYRKARPIDESGIVDMVPAADGEAMMNEIKDIRESLRSFIMDEFLLDMQQMARLSEIKIESYLEVPVTPVDLKIIMRRLTNIPRNQAMVYDVFHKFHGDRFWTANAIDKWFQCEK